MDRSGRVLRSLSGALPALAVGAFMALFFVWPIGGVIARGVGGADPAGLLADVLGSASHRSVIWFTVWQAAVSTALTVAVALPAAGAVARLRFRGQRLVRALATVPFVLPTVVVAAAFEGLFDRFGLAGGGALSLRHTVWAILLAHVFFNYAVVLRTVGAHWAALDARVEDQARVLGASRLQVFGRIVLPRLVPSIAAASAIVFLFSFTSFGVVLVLGGPARATLETEIYRYAVVRLDLSTAAGLAVVQLAAVVALVAVSNALERRRAVAEPASSPAAAPRRRGPGLVANLVVMGLILGLPVAALVERSLSAGRDGGYTLRNYTAMAERVNLLPDTALAALRNSLMFAAPAAALALLVGGAAALVVMRADSVRGRARSWPGADIGADDGASDGRVVGDRTVVSAGPEPDVGAGGGASDGRVVGDRTVVSAGPEPDVGAGGGASDGRDSASRTVVSVSADGRGRVGGVGRVAKKAVGRVFDVGLTLPLGTSAVTVGLGFLLVLNRPPIDIRTSVIVVPIAHAVVGIPFVVRTLVPMLRTVSPRVREAAAVLGASPGRVRREVDLRVAARGVAVGAGFAFAVSLGEFGATSFIPRRPETLTAPLALFRLLGTPGEALRGQAMAVAVALMALTAVAVFVMDLWGDTRQGGF